MCMFVEGVGGKATGEGKREGDRRECVCLWRGGRESYW